MFIVKLSRNGLEMEVDKMLLQLNILIKMHQMELVNPGWDCHRIYFSLDYSFEKIFSYSLSGTYADIIT